MALMNMVSANINQWTMLAAMIPVVYSFSMGTPTFLLFDEHQKKEILLTVSQSLLGMLLLSNMSFHLFEACAIFVLWFAQFVKSDLHTPVTVVYFGWSAVELVLIVFVRRRVAAWDSLVEVWRAHGRRTA
jgi:hypothetical protein